MTSTHLAFVSHRYHENQNKIRYTLEMISKTLEEPSEAIRSVAQDLWVSSPQIKCAVRQIELHAQLAARARTADDHFLRTCFEGPNSR